MTAFQGQVGPQAGADAAILTARLSRDGSAVVQFGHGAMQEAAFRGNLFSLATAAAGVTCTATQVVSTTLSSPIVGIYNPAGSGKNCVILYAEACWASGTAGAGGLCFGTIPSPAGVSAAGGSGSINMLSQVVGGSTAKTFTGAALTGQTVAPGIARVLGGPTTGALAANSMSYYPVYLDGAIIVPPGGVGGLFTALVGSSPIILASMVWEEISA